MSLALNSDHEACSRSVYTILLSQICYNSTYSLLERFCSGFVLRIMSFTTIDLKPSTCDLASEKVACPLSLLCRKALELRRQVHINNINDDFR